MIVRKSKIPEISGKLSDVKTLNDQTTHEIKVVTSPLLKIRFPTPVERVETETETLGLKPKVVCLLPLFEKR